tara:strand:- start:185 stop:580 length:396 start_codon:yes stop_codon:yes gene_type:complete
MKNIILIGFAVFLFQSCEKEDMLLVTSNDAIEMRLDMQKQGYSEVLVHPIQKVECYFAEWDKTIETPVSGLFEYYDNNRNWVASIDFGDGVCDQWAIKTWNVDLFPDHESGFERFSVFSFKGVKGKGSYKK